MIAQLNLREIIKSAGFKHTQTREKVLRELIKSKQAISIDELFEKLQRSVNRVTIYRILDDFTRAGVVYQTDFRTGKAYFEYQKKHHHHVVCTSCGHKQDIDVCVSFPAEKVPNFKTISHHTLEFFGICDRCSVKL